MGESLKDQNPAKVVDEVLDWWRQLVAPPETGQPSRRGELAELRRAKNLEEVLFVPAYHRLFYRVSAQGWAHGPSVAAIAGLLAHVKGDTAMAGQIPSDATAQEEQRQSKAPDTVAALLAAPVKPGLGPRVSESRFQRLVAIRELPVLYPNLLRIIHLAGDRVPVRDLIQSVRYWNDRQRRDWTFRYYTALLGNEGKAPAQTQGA
ncbi:type I-E CRISPR-associated protein Cse2/CasB [Thiorhodovibrio frisius]|uniref:CRISPR type I-E-associated protein CasB/Cse2 n=1 Tax=Thiorhodovibrio frisius TaxID=631362 RepID=H8Z8M9_9GAMM|nr:type I-E CRISPR-associated protein Cse2/CasB [Thiorhodovibrio frisius]EIC19434.1 CRISPR type I-E-associated protein CasB/Cse2 [Thiorhodovibrio frisius]WPL22263.1 CRISPR-associated protein CasB/Cse2 [Thiorhodovibrio frisius]